MKMKLEDLRVCDMQYTIRLEKCSYFKEGDTVFLKTNPELPMIVTHIDIDRNLVYTK